MCPVLLNLRRSSIEEFIVINLFVYIFGIRLRQRLRHLVWLRISLQTNNLLYKWGWKWERNHSVGGKMQETRGRGRPHGRVDAVNGPHFHAQQRSIPCRCPSLPWLIDRNHLHCWICSPFNVECVEVLYLRNLFKVVWVQKGRFVRA